MRSPDHRQAPEEGCKDLLSIEHDSRERMNGAQWLATGNRIRFSLPPCTHLFHHVPGTKVRRSLSYCDPAQALPKRQAAGWEQRTLVPEK